MVPGLIQPILLDGIDDYTKQPLYDDVLGHAIGGGLLNAEGEDWRWQRRLAAPLFRAEDVLAYVPAFAASFEPILQRRTHAGAGTQTIDKDMASATLQVLQDTVLGADLGDKDRHLIEQAGAAFLAHSPWKIALTSLRLPPTIPHPGARSMARAGKTLREVAERVLAQTRASGAQGDELMGRLVTAPGPGHGGHHARRAHRPRSCIGGTFAMLEGKAMLATLIAGARFELPEGERPTPFARITLRPKEGLKLKVTPIQV